MKVTRRQLARLIKESIQPPARSPQFEKIKGLINTAEDDSFLSMADTFIDSLEETLPKEETLLLKIDLALKSNNFKDIPDLVYEVMGLENNFWEPEDVGTDFLQRVMFKYVGDYSGTKNNFANTHSIFNDFNQKYGKNISYAVGAQSTHVPGSKLMLGKTAEMYIMSKEYLSENLNVSEYDWFGFYVEVGEEKIKNGLNSNPAFELTYHPYESKASITVGQQSKLRTYSSSFDPYSDENVFVYAKNDNTKDNNNWEVFSNLDYIDNGLLNGLEIFPFLEEAFPESGNLFKLHNSYED